MERHRSWLISAEPSPHLEPNTRGALVNLSLAHTQADIIRAVLEGVAFSLPAALEVISAIASVDQLLAFKSNPVTTTGLVSLLTEAFKQTSHFLRY
ncbi:hypothetical protein H6G27_11180 [Nostoc linckia FACHB-104]|nr:hypothetical protein [Nostoc linckia FACHB-104]